MSTLLLERSSSVFGEGYEHIAQLRLDDSPLAETADAHGRLTLDELITGVWEGLAVRGAVECPVCASPMAMSSSGSGDGQQTGSCFCCGTKLC
jgi:hypothetical protein